MSFDAWKHETWSVDRVFHKSIHTVLKVIFDFVCLLVNVTDVDFFGQILVPRTRCKQELAIWTPGQSSYEAVVLSIIQEQAVVLPFNLLFVLRAGTCIYLWLTVLILSVSILTWSLFQFFPLFNSVLVVKLHLVFELPVLVNSDCGI